MPTPRWHNVRISRYRFQNCHHKNASVITNIPGINEENKSFSKDIEDIKKEGNTENKKTNKKTENKKHSMGQQ